MMKIKRDGKWAFVLVIMITILGLCAIGACSQDATGYHVENAYQSSDF